MALTTLQQTGGLAPSPQKISWKSGRLRRNGAKSSESALGTTSCVLHWLQWFHMFHGFRQDGEATLEIARARW